MKTASDQQHSSRLVPKPDRTQRFSKQLSQGSANFMTKNNASSKTLVRLSENPLVSKSKTIHAARSTRGGSIPKVVAKESREFGREITSSNNTALQAVTQQTVTIMQGKLKPNVSVPNCSPDSLFFPSAQQVIKKNAITYRTHAFGEKPGSGVLSQSSLHGPHQTASNFGPGQKFIQHQTQVIKKSKSITAHELIPTTTSTVGNDVTSPNLAAKKAHDLNKTSDTPLIKLNQIEENRSCQTVPVPEEDTKTASELDQSEDEEIIPETANKTATKEKLPVSEEFKQRLAAFRKRIAKTMVFSDQLDIRDPQMVAELATDVYRNMRSEEIEKQIDVNYLSKIQTPSEVKDTSRAFLIEWIIDVHRKFRLLPETLYVTIYIIDKFLSLKQIKKSQLHILGVTSLLISTKYEEIYPPELKDLLTVSENKFSRSEVLKMEKEILLTLQFDLTCPSAYRFLERFRKLSSVVGGDDKVFYFAQYLQEISLLDASLLKYKASEIAAASLILASKSLKKVNVWNKEMERATEYSDEFLQPIAEDVKSFVVEVNPKFLTTLKYKFSKQEYKEVANLPFKF